MFTTAVAKSLLSTGQNKYCNLLQRLGPGFICLNSETDLLWEVTVPS